MGANSSRLKELLQTLTLEETLKWIPYGANWNITFLLPLKYKSIGKPSTLHRYFAGFTVTVDFLKRGNGLVPRVWCYLAPIWLDS